MKKQKHGFWVFIFSLIPGAGEMYMGFKKQGLSIMLLFWGSIALASITGLGWLAMFLPQRQRNTVIPCGCERR